MIGLGFSSALAYPAVLQFNPTPWIVRRLADCSYSQYAVHLPIIFLTAMLLEEASAPSGVFSSSRGALLFVMTAMIAVAFANGFARLTERDTSRVQHFMLRYAAARRAKSEVRFQRRSSAPRVHNRAGRRLRQQDCRRVRGQAGQAD